MPYLNRQLLGRRLKEARIAAGLTQDDLVARLGKKTPTGISEYETGKRSFSADELIEFSGALGVPVTYFFQDALQARDDLETQILLYFRQLPTPDARRRALIILDLLREIIISGKIEKEP